VESREKIEMTEKTRQNGFIDARNANNRGIDLSQCQPKPTGHVIDRGSGGFNFKSNASERNPAFASVRVSQSSSKI
jgi:hypothetical protein